MSALCYPYGAGITCVCDEGGHIYKCFPEIKAEGVGAGGLSSAAEICALAIGVARCVSARQGPGQCLALVVFLAHGWSPRGGGVWVTDRFPNLWGAAALSVV